MLESIRLDREYADICSFLAQAIGSGNPFISGLANVLSRFVKAAEMNAKNTIMNSVKNVPRLVCDAQKNSRFM